MNNSELKTRLEAILTNRFGRHSAITSRELSSITLQPDRAIRLAIEDLIRDGLPIVSATEHPAGYFIPSSIEEAREYTQSLRSRAVQIFLRRKKVIRNTALYLKPANQGRLI